MKTRSRKCDFDAAENDRKSMAPLNGLAMVSELVRDHGDVEARCLIESTPEYTAYQATTMETHTFAHEPATPMTPMVPPLLANPAEAFPYFMERAKLQVEAGNENLPDAAAETSEPIDAGKKRASNQQSTSPAEVQEWEDLTHSLRRQLGEKNTDVVKKMVVTLVFFQSLLSGHDQEEAAKFAARTFGVTVNSVLRWKDEYTRDGVFVQQGPHGNRSTKRSWLLEDYPELLLTAQRWVTRHLDLSEEKNEKPFKITEFQNWVNQDLLRPLFENPGRRVVPISHSTARTWLHRLGYYDRVKRAEEDCKDDATTPRKPRARTTSFSVFTPIQPEDEPSGDNAPAPFGTGRKRANTWDNGHHVSPAFVPLANIDPWMLCGEMCDLPLDFQPFETHDSTDTIQSDMTGIWDADPSIWDTIMLTPLPDQYDAGMMMDDDGDFLVDG